MGEDFQEHTQTKDLSPVNMATSASSPKRPVMDKLRRTEAEIKRAGGKRGRKRGSGSHRPTFWNVQEVNSV